MTSCGLAVIFLKVMRVYHYAKIECSVESEVRGEKVLQCLAVI